MGIAYKIKEITRRLEIEKIITKVNHTRPKNGTVRLCRNLKLNVNPQLIVDQNAIPSIEYIM